MEARYAQVHVLDILVHLDMPYTYRLTEEQLMVAAAGDFVVVPFGGGKPTAIWIDCINFVADRAVALCH